VQNTRSTQDGREAVVRLTQDWLGVGSEFGLGEARWGLARLRHYTARYIDLGEGPPLVLVPGLAGGVELLGPLVRLLARDFRVISYQLRGEDDCFALRRQFGLPDLVEDLRELLDFFHLETPHIGGVSFGGMLALSLAAHYPARVDSLVVQGVGAVFHPGMLVQLLRHVLCQFPLPADSPFVNQFFNLFFGGRMKQGPLLSFVTRQCWTTDQGVMAHRFGLVEPFDLRRELARIRARTLVLNGDRDLLVSKPSLQALEQGLHSVRRVDLPGCGHLAFVTHPEWVADEIAAFLA
jgi:3-oxoadipate enol-lactonase